MVAANFTTSSSLATISQDPKWAININSVLKKAQQRMYFLRLLRKHGLPRELLRRFYTAVIESVLCSSITVWLGAATKKDKSRLQRTIKTAEKIVGTPLPTLEDLHAARTKTRACKILYNMRTWIWNQFEGARMVSILQLLGESDVFAVTHQNNAMSSVIFSIFHDLGNRQYHHSRRPKSTRHAGTQANVTAVFITVEYSGSSMGVFECFTVFCSGGVGAAHDNDDTIPAPAAARCSERTLT
ncbi:uncharacterized protein LOC133477182 isoform X1 [Phyllopteryx taeniolatus]|uniref:uncharacterized protein LOC133477182 isoform X1 n=1 Tax=Phyllopteryx taeniolatus TaxID=161469 RepID=UPI002AD43358|nr:uncharacterized protein LOC133477182 isoform X1 [Phyllopteryx taeniolatus]